MKWEIFTLANPPADDTCALVCWLGEATATSERGTQFYDVAYYDAEARRWNDTERRPLSDVSNYAVISDPFGGVSHAE